MATSILPNRQFPPFKPVVDALLDFMHIAAQQLKGEPQKPHAEWLGVDTSVDRKDCGIALDFRTRAATTKAMDEFRARFAALRVNTG